jgi:3-hydroxyisobutyrate dehydrogenase-like beta-hydroxyacid dehydrogenase
MTMNTIAFLGLGAMGARMAAHLAGPEFKLTVWNRDSAKAEALVARGARVATSPREAATGADLVFAMVRDDEASRAIWLDPQAGAFAGMRRSAIAIESSTLSLAFTRTLSSEAEARGLDFLDAPVAGSRPQAEARQLIHLVGGDADVLARAEPALKAMGGAIHHAGPAGAGTALKLAVNALFGVQVAALAELFGALVRQGVNEGTAADILGATPVASPAAKAAMASMVAQAFAPMFPVELVAKDFDYALKGAQEAGCETPISAAARGVFAAALRQSLGALHLTSVRNLY